MANASGTASLDSLLHQEITGFLREVEVALELMPQNIESGRQPLDSTLLQAEWLLRDVLILERLLPSPDGEALTEAVTTVVRNLQVSL